MSERLKFGGEFCFFSSSSLILASLFGDTFAIDAKSWISAPQDQVQRQSLFRDKYIHM